MTWTYDLQSDGPSSENHFSSVKTVYSHTWLLPIHWLMISTLHFLSFFNNWITFFAHLYLTLTDFRCCCKLLGDMCSWHSAMIFSFDSLNLDMHLFIRSLSFFPNIHFDPHLAGFTRLSRQIPRTVSLLNPVSLLIFLYPNPSARKSKNFSLFKVGFHYRNSF